MRAVDSKFLYDRKGVTLVFVAICIFMIIALAALAVDIGHLVVTKNELQNAADAGALAAARYLYNEDGTAINEGCNQIGVDAATANASDNTAVEVALTDVLRGHWSFAAQVFTPNNSTVVVPLWDVTWEELDANEDFINAVQVTAHRDQTPVASWFARIFNIQGFVQEATAVAYIGFAGSLRPSDADQPIAICQQSLKVNPEDPYQCNIGRMLNSGSNDATHNTAGWTNFTQPCSTADANTMSGLICSDGNPESVKYGDGIGASGGVQDNIFDSLADCWRENTGQTSPATEGHPNSVWTLTLPLIDCPGNNVSNCPELVGAVTVNVVWMEESANKYKDAPKSFSSEGWESWPSQELLAMPVSELAEYFVGQGPQDNYPSPWPTKEFPNDANNSKPDPTVSEVFYLDTENAGRVRWASFVDRFDLLNADGEYATFSKKSMYFLPSCEPHRPVGTTQGENYGVLARIPVLVN